MTVDLDRVLDRLDAALERRNVPIQQWEQALDAAVSGGNTAAGVAVVETNALTATAVYTCVRVIAETVASLPLLVYRRRPDGSKERARDHYLYSLLHDSPNPDMTAFEFRESMMAHLLLWGNAYAEMEYDRAGRVTALWPLPPNRVRVERTNGQLHYLLNVGAGSPIRMAEGQVFHLRGLSPDGVLGYSPIACAREAIGSAIATERYGAAFFGSGTYLRGILEHPGKLSDSARANLRSEWETLHRGLDNAHRVAILQEGMKWQQLGIPPEDSQFLESRVFQLQEIARIYRVPLHLVGELSHATFSNIEHMSLEFVKYTLAPWLERWEQGIEQRVFLESDRRGGYFAEHLVDGLLRGDIVSRYQAYAIGRQWGWLSVDEIRERENMNPLPNGEGASYITAPANITGKGPTTGRPMPMDQGGPMPMDRGLPGLRSIGDGIPARYRLRAQYSPLLADAAARVVKREVSDLRKIATRVFSQRAAAGWPAALEEFYARHEGYVGTAFGPPIRSLLNAAARDAGAEVDMRGELSPEFRVEYLTALQSRWVGYSRARLEAALESARLGEELDALEPELEHWGEVRPDQSSRRESVRGAEAAAVGVWMALRTSAGSPVVVGMQWRKMGAETCPYCTGLDGRRTGWDRPFLAEGERYQPDGADHPLSPGTSIGHAPAHDGCDCIVLPERG